jgi:hypothetical protein
MVENYIFQAHIAMAVSSSGAETAIMAPLGRVQHQGEAALVLAYDARRQRHKAAKLWQERSVFGCSSMGFGYAMDSAGTRTTLAPPPLVPIHDISLPVFYDAAPHGARFVADAQRLYDASLRRTDTQGNTVFTIGTVTVTYKDAELR